MGKFFQAKDSTSDFPLDWLFLLLGCKAKKGCNWCCPFAIMYNSLRSLEEAQVPSQIKRQLDGGDAP